MAGSSRGPNFRKYHEKRSKDSNMRATPTAIRRRSSALAAVSFTVGSLTLLGAASMASATPATLCSGDTNYSNLGIQLAQSGETGAVALVTLTTPLTAGNYIVDTVAWDGYEGRSTSVPPELSEKYYIEFVDAAGATVGSTGTTDE